jgi:hypothetical protein
MSRSRFPRRHRLPLARACALLATGALLAGCSQIELARLYFANDGTEVRLAQSLPVTLPFHDRDGWIVVPARVGDAPPIDFVIDTGASMLAVLTSPRTAALGFDVSGAKRLGGADDLAAPTAAAQRGLDIDFGPLTLLDQTVLAIPLDSLKCRDRVPDPPFQGVIGHELFDRYVVEVNYDRGEVVLHDPEHWQYRGAGQVVPADIEGRQPFVQGHVTAPDGSRYPARLHVDSGAGLDLTLFPQTSEAIKVPSGGERGSGCFVGGLAEYQRGSEVALDFGAAHAAQRTPVQYSLGREVIDDGQNGRLGARFLRRYNVIFDYARERMILEPRAPAAPAALAQGG